MVLTGKYLDFLSDGFKAIGNFAFAPFNWAAKGWGEHQSESDDSNLAAEVIECMICLACDAAVCCCKTPIACAGSMVTIPIAGTTALIFGALGVTGLPFVAAIDGAGACYESCSGEKAATDIQESNQNKEEIIQIEGETKKVKDSDQDYNQTTPVLS